MMNLPLSLGRAITGEAWKTKLLKEDLKPCRYYIWIYMTIIKKNIHEEEVENCNDSLIKVEGQHN